VETSKPNGRDGMSSCTFASKPNGRDGMSSCTFARHEGM